MPQSRMRMRPWLELQINSNKIPGLCWLNKEEKVFQIPWKHAAKHGWELEKDACLFRSWAIHTGRYKEDEREPDPKTWKANFRCAMNSLPDIEEVKDQSISKGSSAVRVYRMLEPKSLKKEKKPKSPKSKSCTKSVEDVKTEETAEAASSIQLPDDHSGYALPNYGTDEMGIGNVLDDLSTCHLDNSDWRIPLPDSTNEIYPLQVSPIASSSDATDEEEDKMYIYQQLLSASTWHQTIINGQGFLTSESGIPSLCLDLGFEEYDPATRTGTVQTESKRTADFLLSPLQPAGI